MSAKKFLHFMIIFICTLTASWADEDEIIFFNVGQGHCTLIRRVDHVPLLIDAGSTHNVQRVENHQQNAQGSENGRKVIRSIVDKISEHWRNNLNSDGKLNVIVTHGQDDHVKYIPTILQQLNQGRSNSSFRVLLGGMAEHYRDKFANNPLPCIPYYSADYKNNNTDLFEGKSLGFWDESDCITHLFCPKGNHDPNTWSIITRVKINQQITETNQPNNLISAMIPGDAEKNVQQQMVGQLGLNRAQELESTILLFPHHGAKSLDADWIGAINPQVVIISAGKRGPYYHPRAEALRSLFSILRPSRNNINTLTHNNIAPEKLWSIVDSHRVVYYDETGQFSQSLRSILPPVQHIGQFGNVNVNYESKPYQFSDVPWYINLDPNWRCALLNFPIYTTHTSGTIIFKKDKYNSKPFELQFIDIPTDIEQMAQEIQNLYIDDQQGDYSDFSRLSAQTQERSFRELQECHSEQRARKIFFLCYNIIPVEETEKKELVNNYREIYLRNHLKLIRIYTEALNFADPNEDKLFDRIQNVLFISGVSINDYFFKSQGFKGMIHLGFSFPDKLEKRMNILKLFFELAYPMCRAGDNLNNLFDLFCLVHHGISRATPDFTQEEFRESLEWARNKGFENTWRSIQKQI